MKTHIIENNVVVTTIMATVEQAQKAYPDAICIDAVDGGPGWVYNNGVLSEPVNTPSVDENLAQIKSAVKAYIYSHYDQGQQTTLQGLLISGAEAQKAGVERIWGWVRSVLAYYYIQKAGMTSTTTWDFSSFDATKPADTLQSLVAEI